MATGDPSLLPPPTVLNDEHKKWDVFTFITVFLIITTLVASARLALRWKSKVFGLDDWAMIPALIFYLAHSIVACYVTANAGLGKPIWEVTIQEIELWGKGHVASCFLYPLASGFVRISILLFYDRIFSKTSKKMRRAIQASIALVVCYMIGFVIYAGFLCKPITKFWKPFERAQYCGSNLSYWIYTAVIYGVSLLLDLELLVLPVIPVLRLQMSLKKRLGVIAMFALGASACVAASYKLAMLGLQWGRTGYIDPRWIQTQLSRVVPPQFDQYGYTMWIPTQAELSAAVIMPSLIALRPVFVTAAQKLSTIISHSLGSSFASQITKRSSNPSTDKLHYHPSDRYVRMDGDSRKDLPSDVEMDSYHQA